MKKISLIAAAALIFWSCRDSGTATTEDSSATQKNMDAARVISDAFQSGDVSKIDSVVADDFVDHSDHGDIKGKDSLKNMIKMIHDNLKDSKMELLGRAADHDKIYEEMHFTGTGDGKMVPAGPYDMHSVEVTKYKDGKAVEHWEYNETQEMMKMMGKMQGGGMKMDSTGTKK